MSSSSSDGLELEDNAGSDDELLLEDNPAEGSDDDGGLLLEDNESDGDELLLEDNAGSDDDDELMLEENPAEGDEDEDDDLLLEDNDGADDESDGLALEDNDGGDGGDEDDGLVLEDEEGLVEIEVEEISTSRSGPMFSYGGGNPQSASYAPPAPTGDAPAGGGLAEALQALGDGASALQQPGGIVDPEQFLIPEARTQLDQGMMLNPQRADESHSQWQTRVLQQLTAMCGEKTFTDAAEQMIKVYGDAKIANHMRNVGDDHFASGCYAQARHAYTAGLLAAPKHDKPGRMHCYVNRSAAYLKLGETQLAIDDANAALEIAEGGCHEPKTHRQALLRRAQGLGELGMFEQAEEDLELLGSQDSAARRLRKKLRKRAGLAAAEPVEVLGEGQVV